MNITVLIPRQLQGAFEGRSQIELGVPSNSTEADVLQTLLTLYPMLQAHMATESAQGGRSFGMVRSGERLYLFATSAPRGLNA